MPSKHMLPKGKRRHTVKPLYRATRGVEPPPAPAPVPVPVAAIDLRQGVAADREQQLSVPAEAQGLRLDQYLAQAIPDISRSRVQLLIEQGKVSVGGERARAKHRLTAGERIDIVGSPVPPPLHARAEAIPLAIVFEDRFLAVVDKPAGMTVHAGAGMAEAGPPMDLAPTKGPESGHTLVNALLHHFGQGLSGMGGALRPGIVHRLDKQTSGLIVVAKDDLTHRRLGEQFAARLVGKTYLALVHGHLAQSRTTVSLPIGRDLVRRTRMTTRRAANAPGVRTAVSHVAVLERLSTPFGPFTRVSVTIETGRTHQIRVHLQALGHPVVGDTLYGAPRLLHRTETVARGVAGAKGLRTRPAAMPAAAPAAAGETLSLARNFLHAAELRLTHPHTGEPLAWAAPLPDDLVQFLAALQRAG